MSKASRSVRPGLAKGYAKVRDLWKRREARRDKDAGHRPARRHSLANEQSAQNEKGPATFR